VCAIAAKHRPSNSRCVRQQPGLQPRAGVACTSGRVLDEESLRCRFGRGPAIAIRAGYETTRASCSTLQPSCSNRDTTFPTLDASFSPPAAVAGCPTRSSGADTTPSGQIVMLQRRIRGFSRRSRFTPFVLFCASRMLRNAERSMPNVGRDKRSARAKSHGTKRRRVAASKHAARRPEWKRELPSRNWPAAISPSAPSTHHTPR
jgi:hypothetical protein